MKPFFGKIKEIQQNGPNSIQAVVSLAGGKAPQPGQYFQAHRVADQDAVTAVSLFPGGITDGEAEDSFTTAPHVPAHWQPGDELLLRGPLGKGFALPNHAVRLALASLSDECAHLLPLAAEVLARGGEVALFTEYSTPRLPAQLEISPLAGLEKALLWANFLAVSGMPEQVAALKADLYPRKMMPCPAQALVLIPMPCGGLAECGVCALPDRKGQTLLACEDGPVFEWNQLPEMI
jgi:NAD(P)H-flavin reductase